jgi:hypothetical protein
MFHMGLYTTGCGIQTATANGWMVTDGLAPALRRRGLIRDGYEGRTFRENLLAF